VKPILRSVAPALTGIRSRLIVGSSVVEQTPVVRLLGAPGGWLEGRQTVGSILQANGLGHSGPRSRHALQAHSMPAAIP
jgi:hypothetical protein